jgi:hypothetical protein
MPEQNAWNSHGHNQAIASLLQPDGGAELKRSDENER